MLVHDVEQGSADWFAIRAGLPTASNAKKLVTSKGEPSKSMKEYAIELANDLYVGEPVDAWEGNRHTERGHELEPDAADYYEFLRGEELQVIGFCTDGKYGFSPDRFIGDDGILEIKCLSAKYHTKALMYFAKNKAAPTDYIAQPQFMLFGSKRKYCDLLFYHPQLPSLIIRQEPVTKIIETIETQIDAVIKERDSIIEILRAA